MSLSQSLRDGAAADWSSFQTCRFVQEMADGTIAEGVYRRYLAQERRFVRVALRVFAFALARCADEALASRLAHIVSDLATEQTDYFDRVAGDATLAGAPDAATELGAVALAIAERGSTLEILAAMLAAEWSYAEWCRGAADAGAATGFAREWINLHAAPGFQDQAVWMRETVDRLAANADAEELRRCSDAFARMLAAEIAFHAAPYDAGWAAAETGS